MNTVSLTFSIVVSTIDRAVQLRTLLRSLEHQSYSHFEVIVVVGPTCDNTMEVLREYSHRVRVLHCPTANLSQSRNIGILAARGDIIAFIDDDAVPCYRWLEQLARLFREQSLHGTGGMVYTIHPNHSTIQHRLGIASCLAEQVDVPSSRLEQVMALGRGNQWLERVMGTNMAFRRDALLTIGGFDEFYQYIAEETDLVFRLANAGMNVQPVKEAVVYHIPASSRNRTVFTNKGKWWLRSRSRVYFAIKNGWAAGESIWSIAWQSVRAIGAHWLWYTQLIRYKQLTPIEFFVMAIKEVLGGIEAAWQGIGGSRQLIDPSVTKSIHNVQPIHQYQQDSSLLQPSIDPVNGSCPSITLQDPPLRICLLSGMYPPMQYDGIGRHTNLLARGLFERGHTVHVIARGEREQVSFYDGAYVHRVVPCLDRYPNYRSYLNLFHTLNYSHTVYDQVRRLVLNDGIQVVDSPLWQYEGLVTAVQGEIPVVTRLYTSMSQILEMNPAVSRDLQLVSELETAFAKLSAYYIPNSVATLQAAQKRFGFQLPVDKYTIIPHGLVPLPDEMLTPINPAQIPETWTILYVGRLEKRKGILDLFQAIPNVLERIPNMRFVIAGADNSYHDGFQMQTGATYPEYFARHFARYATRVEFKGAVSDEELQKLYATCDLFVAPSVYESFGLIYLEAMNYAKPVIGCRAGGIPEVVDDGVTGVLVEPEAPTALGEAIVSLLRSPARLREMGLAGRQRLLRDFTYLKMAEAFERVYRYVISASGKE